MSYDVVTRALIKGAKVKAAAEKKARELLWLKLYCLTEDYGRDKNQPINLPRYKCYQHCEGRKWLNYDEFVAAFGEKPRLKDQLPQCHICTRFETEDNPLFPYSILDYSDDYKFIYRCSKGHSHDHGMVLLDAYTGLEMHL